MRIVIAATALLALSACASTEKVLSKEPTQVYYTATPPQDVAFCLANKNNTVPMPRSDGSTVVLLKNGYGGVSLAFTIWPDPKGSRIEYRKQFGTIGGAWKQCVGAKD